MSNPTKRRRLIKASDASNIERTVKVFPKDPLSPAGHDDKRNWKGFCELESEPAFFNILLKNFGVCGVKVHEVVSLDQDSLDSLPRPVYGLLFLSRWREDNPIKQEQSCPEGVWFANQTVDNACASVALLNIINNVPDIDLGDNLRGFKDFTQKFSPAMRGSTIAEFEFLREIHNSFARKMDMLNADMQLSCNSTLLKRGKSANEHQDDTHVSFHFIAFVPIEGQIWKLDGLERQPQKLCTIEEKEWIHQTKPQIEALMAEYEEDQIEFSILSLVKAPLSGLISALAQNVRGLSTLSTYAETTEANTRLSTGSFVDAGGNGLGCIVSGPDPIYGLTQDIINQAVILPAVQDAIQSRDELRVAQLWRDLTVAQAGLRASIREEQLCDQSDQERADGRRFDYGPSIHNVIRSLARKRFFTSENV